MRIGQREISGSLCLVYYPRCRLLASTLLQSRRPGSPRQTLFTIILEKEMKDILIFFLGKLYQSQVTGRSQLHFIIFSLVLWESTSWRSGQSIHVLCEMKDAAFHAPRLSKNDMHSASGSASVYSEASVDYRKGGHPLRKGRLQALPPGQRGPLAYFWVTSSREDLCALPPASCPHR